jgi:hypothetical protein
MPPTLWQQLGGLVYTGENLSRDQVTKFKAVGGSWVAPWLYHDDVVADYNLAHVEQWRQWGVIVGGCFNCFGGNPETDATNIARIVTDHALPLAIIDLEAAYQYPGGNANLMPDLTARLRAKLPRTELCVSTNGLNGASIWNGRTLSPPRSFYDLGVRVAPQWYSSPRYEGSCWASPVCNMRWLTEHGHVDGNFHDPDQRYGRGVPLSYVHPSLEPTGVEDADLAASLIETDKARGYGFTVGLNLYALERVPAPDWPLLDRWRGRLWL